MFKRILVPLDGSELAEKALPYAEALAQKFDAELIVLRVSLMVPEVIGTQRGAGCTSAGQAERLKLVDLPLAPIEEMPDYVQEAEPKIQEAYRFASANPESLKHIPCYCGCNSLGHQSNLECYLTPSGAYDQHAAFCGVCIDITQDVMKEMVLVAKSNWVP